MMNFGTIADEDIAIGFDDSIFEDTETEQQRDRENVAAGLMSKVEYRMKWYGEDDVTAAAKVAEEPQRWIDLANLGFIPPYKAVAKLLNMGDDEAKRLYEEEQLRRAEASKAAASMYEPNPEDEEDTDPDETDPPDPQDGEDK